MGDLRGQPSPFREPREELELIEVDILSERPLGSKEASSLGFGNGENGEWRPAEWG
jgi:hypothetical protein